MTQLSEAGSTKQVQTEYVLSGRLRCFVPLPAAAVASYRLKSQGDITTLMDCHSILSVPQSLFHCAHDYVGPMWGGWGVGGAG